MKFKGGAREILLRKLFHCGTCFVVVVVVDFASEELLCGVGSSFILAKWGKFYLK